MEHHEYSRGIASVSVVVFMSFLLSLGGIGSALALYQNDPSTFMKELQAFMRTASHAADIELPESLTPTPTPETSVTPTPTPDAQVSPTATPTPAAGESLDDDEKSEDETEHDEADEQENDKHDDDESVGATGGLRFFFKK